jgi:hypothetical protein
LQYALNKAENEQRTDVAHRVAYLIARLQSYRRGNIVIHFLSSVAAAAAQFPEAVGEFRTLTVKYSGRPERSGDFVAAGQDILCR